ncbi:hypothetical protein TCE0_034f11216 [Talaromyces pinophilus]|uniref:DUF7770 domain-containing protein n=1 Tax=Talaromyces pinophilus TaxID=128442 RepID=A0A6V8HH46_TALPI|nr:hypothetical protein TCE0_034f11216 [Talaromyces pinophilus]
MDEPPGYVPDSQFDNGSERAALEGREYHRPAPSSLILARCTEDQTTIRNYKIVSAYIAACPPFAGMGLINEWRIVCRINHRDTYEISLKVLPCRPDEVCEYNDTYLQLAPGPKVMTNGRLDGMAKTFKISVSSGSTIGDLIDEIFEKNLNQYQFWHGRGNRYWLWGILQVATRTFHAMDENVTGMTYLSQGWDKEFPIRPGDFQAPARGIWLDNSAWYDYDD